eukprot:SM000037S13542  [mRNA]  locus=s37:573119:576148:+ [translate_table: standard]
MQLGQSPYAGFAYHGSPLLVALLGPLAARNLSFLPATAADLASAALLQSLGDLLGRSAGRGGGGSAGYDAGRVASLLYLASPYAIAACAGGSTAPYENLAVLLSLRSAAAGDIPMAAFGFVLAVHLSLYPITLIVPILLLLRRGPDRPKAAKRLAQILTLQAHRQDKQSRSVSALSAAAMECDNPKAEAAAPSGRVDRALRAWRGWPPGAVEASLFALWSALWGAALAALCILALRRQAGAAVVLPKYFFAEVFEHFRVFFAFAFHAAAVLLLPPLALRLAHRPLFLAFAYTATTSLLKSYPSVGDTALYLGLASLFVPQLAGMRFLGVIGFGFAYVASMGLVMYDLWIWKGIGNANFYFAVGLVNTLVQSVFVVESVHTVLQHDRALKRAGVSAGGRRPTAP